MKPVMVCTKQEIHLKPNSDAYVESYTVGTTTFPKRVEFHDSADAKDWTIQCRGGEVGVLIGSL